MIVGTVLVVYFGSRGGSSSGFLSLDDILNLLHRVAAYAGWVIFGTAVIVLGGYSIWMDRRLFAGTIARKDKPFRATILTRCIAAGIL